jgi:chloramphenicol 3-O-phosphotransferase
VNATTANSERAGDVTPGQIVVLNGPPRSGKSSIADVIQVTFDGPWLNLGVDVFSQQVTPPALRPGRTLVRLTARPSSRRPRRPLQETPAPPDAADLAR